MKKRGKGENAGKRRRDGEDFPNEYRKNTASEQDEQGKGVIRRDATVKREKEKQSARPLIANRERPALPPFRICLLPLPSASAPTTLIASLSLSLLSGKKGNRERVVW